MRSPTECALYDMSSDQRPGRSSLASSLRTLLAQASEGVASMHRWDWIPVDSGDLSAAGLRYGDRRYGP